MSFGNRKVFNLYNIDGPFTGLFPLLKRHEALSVGLTELAYKILNVSN
jgi:hypothetical protein